MGMQFSANWCLNYDITSVEKDKIYDFFKEGNRIFPLEKTIDLINSKRCALAKILVTEFTNRKGETRGKFKVIEVYEGVKKDNRTEYRKENI